MSVASSSHPATAPVAPSRSLRQKLLALRRKHVAVAVLTGLALAVAVGIEVLAIVMFLDWWLELPWTVRLVLLVAQAGLQVYLLGKHVLPPLLRPPDEDDLALMVEKARPEFQSRLISAVQLTRPGAVRSGTAIPLVSALVDETEALARSQDFRAIIPMERLQRIGLLALSVLLLATAGMAYGRSTCWDLLQRALLSNIPVPRKTQVIVLEGDKVIGRGDSVRLEAYAQGIIPADGLLQIRYPNRRVQELSLEQNRTNAIHFGRTIENVQDSFTYVIKLNDGTSGRHQVRAIPRPTVARMTCLQQFPEYTGLEPMQRPVGDLTLLAGSMLHLDITATKEIRTAALRLIGPDTRVPLAIDPDQPRHLTGAFQVPAEGLNGFSIELVDTQNMASRDAAVYRVEILPDKPPRVDITYPERKEELVTRLATLLVGMRVEDDFQIKALRLHYKIDTLDASEQSIELDLGTDPVRQLQRAFPWDLASFNPPLPVGSLIEFWLEAEDANDTTGPGVGSSPHQLARVVSREDKLADVLNRASDYLSGLEDVAADQLRANRNLGEVILEKASPSRDP